MRTFHWSISVAKTGELVSGRGSLHNSRNCDSSLSPTSNLCWAWSNSPSLSLFISEEKERVLVRERGRISKHPTIQSEHFQVGQWARILFFLRHHVQWEEGETWRMPEPDGTSEMVSCRIGGLWTSKVLYIQSTLKTRCLVNFKAAQLYYEIECV